MFNLIKNIAKSAKLGENPLPHDTAYGVAMTLHQFTQYTLDEFGWVGLIGLSGDSELIALEAYEVGAAQGMLEGAYRSPDEVGINEVENILRLYVVITAKEERVLLQYAKFGIEIDPELRLERLKKAARSDVESVTLGLEQARQLIRYVRGDVSEPDYEALRRLLAQRHKANKA